MPRLFDRFSRGDSARSSAGHHFGLGLPLVQRIAKLLGHELEVRTEHGSDFRVTLGFRWAGVAAD